MALPWAPQAPAQAEALSPYPKPSPAQLAAAHQSDAWGMESAPKAGQAAQAALTPQRITPTYQADPAELEYERRKAQNIALGGSGNIPRSYSTPGNLADAVGSAALKAQTGASLSMLDALKGYDRDAGPQAPVNVIRRAQRGDGGAANQVADMFGGQLFREALASKDPRLLRDLAPLYLQAGQQYQEAMQTGRLPWERQREEATAERDYERQQAERAYGDRRADVSREFGLKEGAQAESARRFDVEQTFREKQASLEAEYRRGTLSLEQYKAETQRNQYEAEMKLRREGLDFQREQANKPADPLDTELKVAQVAKAKRDLARDPEAEQKNAQAATVIQQAKNYAAQLMEQNPTMSAAEAQRRAFDQYAGQAARMGIEIDQGELAVADRYVGTTPRDLQLAAENAKFGDAVSMVDALAGKALPGFPRAGRVLSWLNPVPGSTYANRAAERNVVRADPGVRQRLTNLLREKGVPEQQADAMIDAYLNQ
ncbi:MAG: hypothetical protein M5U26_03490 [Planctomycetota bacterium]|nr:hypothetical protein [Planctomycetota bacterium]